jgi:serine/threonine protein kinase
VKRLKNSESLSPSQRETAAKSMQRELEVLKEISHPNMIRLLGFCTSEARAGGELCLLYELGVHGSLAQCLQDDARAARMTPKIRTRILGAISAALNYLHQSHQPPVYHRDIKSANIVLCEGMIPKLIDCGLAKLLTDDEAEAKNKGKSVFTVGATGNGRMGTPEYSCPKYMKSGKYGEKSEVYSLGTVFLEVLVGKLTFDEAFEDLGIVDYYEDDDDGLTKEQLDQRGGAWPDELSSQLIGLAVQCVEEKPKSRPGMRQIVSTIRTLERQFCPLTIEELRGHLDLTDDKLVKLIAAKREEDAIVKAAEELEQQKLEEEKQNSLRKCIVCFDEMSVTQGLECCGTLQHFHCSECLSGHVMNESSKDLADLKDRQGRVFCIWRKKDIRGNYQCDFADPFSEAQLASHCSDGVFAAYLQGVAKVTEARLAQDMEAGFEERMKAERARIEAMTEAELKIDKTRRHIIEEILTLKCPRCEAAFVDFNGCFALTCHRCACGFCAHCLQDCGQVSTGDVAFHYLVLCILLSPQTT